MRRLALLAALACGSCYSPTVPDGKYLCGSDGVCPDNLTCNACGVCVQSGEALDAQAMCPADMTLPNGCSKAILCVITNCIGSAMGFQGCVDNCGAMATQETQTMYFEPLIKCVASGCNCDTKICKMCANDAITPKGNCGLDVINCGTCFDLYMACENAP